MTFLGVVIHHAKLSGYHGTGFGVSTSVPSRWAMRDISGIYRSTSCFCTAIACLEGILVSLLTKSFKLED
jgi:hypothetical protein